MSRSVDMLPATHLFGALLLVAAACLAQPTVAPTLEPVGPARGDNWNDYNIVDSFETGYRFSTTGGSLDQYRSTVNYGDGVRLLASFLSINSKDGHGKFFDQIVLTTQGLGNDPYESATLRIEKNRLYRYDLNWRLNDYYNPGLRTGGQQGQHLLDTEYTTSDQDLTLFPQSNVKFFLGYTRGDQNGPAISTIQLFDSRGNEFPLFENVRRVRNEYRIGNEIRLFGIRFTWMHGWEDFKEDSAFSSGLNLGNNPGNPTTLSSFQRSEPYHGTSPYWRGGLFTEREHFSASGRATYTSGQRDFILDENAAGPSRFGLDTVRQVVTAGNAQRPVFAGNLTLSYFPISKLTLTNQTTVNNIRIDGNSVYAEFDNAAQAFQYAAFEFLGIRTLANETSLNYQATRWLGVYGGYQYSDRQIRSQEATLGSAFNATSEQTNALHEGLFGLRLKPVKPLSILLEGEVGHTNRPLSPIAERNYHVLGARLQYKVKTFSFTAATRENYNTNSVSLSSYASHSRNYSADASWTPRNWFALDAGYSKLHLDTAGGIDYFANGQSITGQQSIYVSNLHIANLSARFALNKRADFLAGYSHTQDTGDGRSSLLAPGIGPALPAFQAAQTFPLRFLSPMARLSIQITEKIRWNVGYQYYGYNERFLNGEDYRAHTGYSSVLWSF